MMNDWLITAILLSILVAAIAVAERLRLRLGWSAEVTRKFVHISTGILLMFTPQLLNTSAPLIILAIIFVVANFVAVRLHLLQGMHGTKRESYGTVFYPLAVLILLLTAWQAYPLLFQIGIASLAFADSLAAIIGESIQHPHRFRLGSDWKSLEGSTIMFLTTFLIVLLGVCLFPPEVAPKFPIPTLFLIAVVTAGLTTATEAFSISGSDNITVPLTAAFVLHFLTQNEGAIREQFIWGTILALSVALFSYRVKFLTRSGAAAAFFLGTLLFGIGGWPWSVPILFFFFASSVLSRIGRNRKLEANLLYEKSSRRDGAQVWANGGLPGMLVVGQYFWPNPLWSILYLGAVAAVTADTWGTEIGGLSKWQPVLITTIRKVPAGTSGAISLPGTLGAVVGSLLLAATGISLLKSTWQYSTLTLLTIVSAGFLGSVFDSILGATMQAQYRCPACNKQTERRQHCGNHTTIFIRGFQWCNNDIVNFLCSLFAVVLVILFTTLFNPRF